MKLWGFINGEQVEIDSETLPQEVQNALHVDLSRGVPSDAPRVEESDQFDPFDVEDDVQEGSEKR